MSYSENLQGPLVAGYIYNVGRLPAIWLSEEIIRNQEYLEAISDGGDDIKFTDTLFINRGDTLDLQINMEKEVLKINR